MGEDGMWEIAFPQRLWKRRTDRKLDHATFREFLAILLGCLCAIPFQKEEFPLRTFRG